MVTLRLCQDVSFNIKFDLLVKEYLSYTGKVT